MVMINVGDAKFARETFSKAHKAMRESTHIVTEDEYQLFRSVHTQLSRIPSTKYDVINSAGKVVKSDCSSQKEARDYILSEYAVSRIHCAIEIPNLAIRTTEVV